MKYTKAILPVITLATHTPCSLSYLHHPSTLPSSDSLSKARVGFNFDHKVRANSKSLPRLFSEVRNEERKNEAEFRSFDEHRVDLHRVQEEKEKLEEQLTLLSEEQKAYIIERDEEVEHMEQVSGELLDTKNKLSQMSRKLEEQRRQTRKAETEKQKVEKKLRQIQEKIDITAKENSELKKQAAAHVEQMAEFTDVQKLKDRNSELEENLVTAKAEKKQLLQKLRAAELQIVKLEAAESMYNKLKQDLKILKSEKAALEEKLQIQGDNQVLVDELQRKLLDTNSANAQLKDDAKTWMDREEALRQQLKQLETKLLDREENLASTDKDRSAKEIALEKEVKQLKKDILELQNTGKSRYQSMQDLQLQLSEAMATQKTIQGEKDKAVRTLQTTRVKFEQQNRSLQELMEKNRQSYRKMFEELEQEELELRAQLECVQDLEKEICALEQREREAFQKAKEEAKRAEALQQGLALMESKAFYETNDKHMALAELENMKKKYDEDMLAQKEKISKYVSDIEHKDDQAFKSRAAIQRARNQVKKLERQLQTAKDVHAQDVRKLETDLQAAEQQRSHDETLSAGRQLMHDTMLEARHDVLRRKQNLHAREKGQLQSKIKTLEVQVQELSKELEEQSEQPTARVLSWFGSLRKKIEEFVLADFDMQQKVDDKGTEFKKAVNMISNESFNPL